MKAGGTPKKDIRRIIAALEDQGAVIVIRTSGFTIRFPDKSTTTFHWTNSDWRAVRNMRATVRRAGFAWPLDDATEVKRRRKARRLES